jgi:putative membrane protein
MIDWRHWHNEPWLVGGLVFLGWLWTVLAGPWRVKLAPNEPFPRRHAWRFYTSLVVFYLAVGSPLDQIGEGYLFSAHMLQHQLLIYPAAALFLIGIPHWMIDPVLGRPALGRIGRLLTHPIVCCIVYTLVISLWHSPAAYDYALRHKLAHVAEHIAFFSVALLYWWPVISPSRVFPPIRYGAQMLYVLAVVIAMTPVFAYITFADEILYPTYEYAPRLIADFSPADDQLLAGVSMKIVGMLVAGVAFSVSFYRWYQGGLRDEPQWGGGTGVKLPRQSSR